MAKKQEEFKIMMKELIKQTEANEILTVDEFIKEFTVQFKQTTKLVDEAE